MFRRLNGDTGKLAMAGGDYDRRYSVLAHEIVNERHRKDGELTVSRMEAFLAFGMGSRG